MIVTICRYLVLFFMFSFPSFCASDDIQEHKIPEQKKPMSLINNILTPEAEELDNLIDEIWKIKQIDMFGMQKSFSFQNLLEKKKLEIENFFQNNPRIICGEHFDRMKHLLGNEFINGLNLMIIEEDN